MGNNQVRQKPPNESHITIAQFDMPQPAKRKWPFGKRGGKRNSPMDSPYGSDVINLIRQGKIDAMETICVNGYLIGGQYEVSEILGGGSFGKVLKAYDYDTRKDVAIKVTKDAGDASKMEGEKEFRILNRLNSIDPTEKHHLIKILDGFRWMGRYFYVFEYYSQTLRRYVEQSPAQRLSMKETVLISRQLVDALAFLSNHHIIHCDLKPDNIMVKDSKPLEVKVIDFGSCQLKHSDMEDYYKVNECYLQTRYYRAPEVLLCLPFGRQIDMWSLGCIVAEMYSGEILFAGRSTEDQLKLITEACGEPPKEMLKNAGRTFSFLNQVRTRSKANPEKYGGMGVYYRRRPKNLFDLLQMNTPDRFIAPLTAREKSLVDLITDLLELDPQRRIKAVSALDHKLFKNQSPRKK